MNYRHAFHAGNHADALKHALLALALGRLVAKPKPLVVVDAFAGAGRTDLLLDDRADRTGEWRGGVGRIETPPPAALAPWLAAVDAENAGAPTEHARRFYPGSPLLALRLMRPDDKLLAVERHPEEAEALRRLLADDRRARVYEGDGWAALRSFLPPTPRRGLVLIDPPFEVLGEHDRLARALADGLSRFATGVFLLWSPIKDEAAHAAYRAALTMAAGATPLLLAELRVAPDGAPGLLGSALAVANPPYGFETDAAAAGWALAERLADPRVAAPWRLHRMVAPR